MNEDLQSKCDEYLNGWKRALADYDNLKKDMAREKAAMREAIVSGAAEEMLPVADMFEQAFKSVPDRDDQLRNWLAGVRQVGVMLEDALKRLGLEPFGAEGEAFDPARHESAGSRSNETKADHEILEVVARGWKLGERIVRPARVIINAK